MQDVQAHLSKGAKARRQADERAHRSRKGRKAKTTAVKNMTPKPKTVKLTLCTSKELGLLPIGLSVRPEDIDEFVADYVQPHQEEANKKLSRKLAVPTPKTPKTTKTKAALIATKTKLKSTQQELRRKNDKITQLQQLHLAQQQQLDLAQQTSVNHRDISMCDLFKAKADAFQQGVDALSPLMEGNSKTLQRLALLHTLKDSNVDVDMLKIVMNQQEQETEPCEKQQKLQFCGHCGESCATAFCRSCGNEQ